MKRPKKEAKDVKTDGKGVDGITPKVSQPKYPRHPLEKALRLPRALLEQNAGRECTDKVAAGFLGLKSARGAFSVEIGSGLKFGLLERPSPGKLAITDLARRILHPQSPTAEIEGFREATLKSPNISEVYNHYRGENLPDEVFFDNALVDKFGIPREKVAEFRSVFFDTLNKSKLIEEHNGKNRIIDFSKAGESGADSDARIKKLGKEVKIESGDSCFVMMPFGKPLGDYFTLIYKQAIEKAGMKAVRADAEIFGTGKIMDQIWTGINSAKVLVAELTTKNPNVFYELGLAHALKKPVVLISSNENDVPFDLQHIRVIYYDVTDPFWGQKLLDKVAENILSAVKNPEEAIFKS